MSDILVKNCDHGQVFSFAFVSIVEFKIITDQGQGYWSDRFIDWIRMRYSFKMLHLQTGNQMFRTGFIVLRKYYDNSIIDGVFPKEFLHELCQ